MIGFAQCLDLNTAAALVDSRLYLARHGARCVVLVLYVAEYLLHKVFERDESGGASELVDHHRHGAFFGQQPLHELLGKQCFRGEHHRLDGRAPVVVGLEQLADVDISLDVVDIFVVDHDLASSRRCEQAAQLVARGGGQINGYDLVARLHAVAYMGCREVESVVEYLHFVFDRSLLRVDLVDSAVEI